MLGTEVKKKRAGRPSRRSVRDLVRPDDLCTSPALEASIRSDLSEMLALLKADPARGRAERFKASYLEREIFSKYLDPADSAGPMEREQAAIAKWRLAELRNETTNVRLCASETSFTIKGKEVTSTMILERARETIGRVLGKKFPDMEVLYGTFTSGASTKFSHGPGVLEKKFMDEAHVTASALEWFWFIRSNCEGWMSNVGDGPVGTGLVEIVNGNMMFTVPKTTEIDRCAAKEPGLNMFLQKGVGAYLKHRLKSVLQQDLNDQSVNQRLALQGSVTGKLATLDLSSASDLISCQLVRDLLPLEWFCLLDDIRSKNCLVNGEWVELNMFSSMGNAFTFELETLIFWAIVNACAYFAGVRGTISVYGDDIVCPSEVAGLVARVFAWFGFKVNTKKSFWHGPFRESCGKHYYAGMDVTPFYVKEPISSIPRLIHFLNRLRQWTGKDVEFHEGPEFDLWSKYKEMVPRRWRGGRDLNDIGQLVTDETPIKRLIGHKKPYQVDVKGAYLHWLRAASTNDDRPSVSIRYSLHGLTIDARSLPTFMHLRQSGLVVDVKEALITSRVETETNRYRELLVTDAEKHIGTVPAGYVPGWP